MGRRLWTAAGLLMVGIGAVGVLVPGLPTTVFILIAAWAFARGNPERAARLGDHPVFGPLIKDWRRNHAIPRTAKILAILTMAFSLLCLFLWSALPLYGIIFLGLVMGVIATWMLLCPTAQREARSSAAPDHQG